MFRFDLEFLSIRATSSEDSVPVKPKFGVAPLLVQIELIFSNNK